MYMWMYMRAHAWKIPRSTFFYLILRGRVSQSNPELTDMVVSLAAYSESPWLSFRTLNYQLGCYVHPVFI